MRTSTKASLQYPEKGGYERRMMMEEQKKEMQENPEVTEAKDLSGQEAAAPDRQSSQPPAIPTRSYMLMCLAGVYLLYTGYKLCKNVLDGVEGASWGFFCAGAAFLVIGAGMVFIGVRTVMRRDKEEKAAKAAGEGLETAAQKAEEKSAVEQEKEPKKSMSIAERANLASHLDDVSQEADPEEEQEEKQEINEE